MRPGMATTLGVIATDATLSKAECQKVSGLGHDGLARAINPVHTLLDGDTLFTVATGERPAPDLAGLYALMAAAGDCVTRAVGHAMLAADIGHHTGRPRCARGATPSPPLSGWTDEHRQPPDWSTPEGLAAIKDALAATIDGWRPPVAYAVGISSASSARRSRSSPTSTRPGGTHDLPGGGARQGARVTTAQRPRCP